MQLNMLLPSDLTNSDRWRFFLAIAACEALGFTGILLDSFEGFLERWQALFPEIETGFGAR